jgi:hypothetical protein
MMRPGRLMISIFDQALRGKKTLSYMNWLFCVRLIIYNDSKLLLQQYEKKSSRTMSRVEVKLVPKFQRLSPSSGTGVMTARRA